MAASKIDYVDTAWNPATGCSPVSAGCKNCWARGMATRFAGTKAWPNGFAVTLHHERLEEPLHQRKPRRVAVCFCGDLFHEDVPSEFIWQVLDAAASAKQHQFLFLTKRPARMRDIVTDWHYHYLPGRSMERKAPGLWLGVSVENQKAASERIPILLETPAAVRWISAEPLLEPLDLGRWLCKTYSEGGLTLGRYLDWCVVGAESGPKARHCDPLWLKDIKDQCVAAKVPVWIKQVQVDGKLVHAPEIDGQKWLQVPEGSIS